MMRTVHSTLVVWVGAVIASSVAVAFRVRCARAGSAGLLASW